MANGASTSDIIKGTLQRAGEVTNGNSSYHQLVLKYINQVYLSILSGSNEFDIDASTSWSWAKAEDPKSIILETVVDTGTVSLTNGSTSGTFSSAPAASMADRYLKLDDRPEFFKILAHTAAATSFTIDAKYSDDTGSTLSFKAIPVLYDLGSNVLRLVEPAREYRTQSSGGGSDDGKINGMDITSMRTSFPLKHITQAVPTFFSVIYESDSKFVIQFSHYPDKQTKVDFDYIPYPSDLFDSIDSVPIIPRDHREVLELGAAYYILNDKRQPDDAQNMFALTQRKIKAMVEDDKTQMDRTNDKYGELIPRGDQVRGFRRRFTALADM